MDEVSLIVVAIILFFFGYQIRPWIVTKYPEQRYMIDLMIMAVTITTILIPLVFLIASGTVFVGIYFIVLSGFIVYVIYYGFKNSKELKGKSRRALIVFSILYAYIFLTSGALMYLAAPFMPNVKL